MLFHITDIYTNGFIPSVLDVASLVAIFLGVLVITTKSPVIAILFLIGLFSSVSIYLALMNLMFLALAYLLVYVGAVSILFLFILMLIDVRNSELYSGSINSASLALLVGLSFILAINIILPVMTILSQSKEYLVALYSYIFSESGAIPNDIYYVTSAMSDGYLTQTSHIASIGNIMFTSHAAWIVITSLILLLAMVGAIVITIKLNPAQHYYYYYNKIANKILLSEPSGIVVTTVVVVTTSINTGGATGTITTITAGL